MHNFSSVVISLSFLLPSISQVPFSSCFMCSLYLTFYATGKTPFVTDQLCFFLFFCSLHVYLVKPTHFPFLLQSCKSGLCCLFLSPVLALLIFVFVRFYSHFHSKKIKSMFFKWAHFVVVAF